MALDYHLDRKLRLSEESKLKSLYSWSIQEFEGEAQKGPDYIPFNWTLNFTATEVTYRQQLALGERYRFAGPDKGDADGPQGFVERENIRANLQPGYVNEDPRWGTSYSMFGTDRAITDIAVWIVPVEDGDDRERCVVHGGLSYTTEVDFRDETSPDYLHFYVSVSRERFAELKGRVKNNDFDFLVMTVNRVQGFYAEWSPGISANRIKVLSEPEDHKLVLPEGTEIVPPALNDLDHCELHFLTERKTQLPIFKDDDEDASDDFYGANDPVEHERARADNLLRLVAQLEDRSKKTQIALWIIAALMLVALFK